MRIGIVTEASSAGVGRHVIDLCEALADGGHEVHLLYSRRRIDAAFEEGVRALAKRIRSEVVDMRRAPHTSDVRILREIRQYVREHGPFDVLHGQSSKGGALVRLVQDAAAGAIVYTPHCVYTLNPTAGRLSRFVYGRAELWLERRTDAVIAVSPTEAEHLVHLGFDSKRVHCVPNGVGAIDWLDRDAARDRLDLPRDARVIAYLARLSTQKNPVLMVDAFARVAAQDPQAILALAGTGDLLDACHEAATRHGITHRIRWLGYQRPETVFPSADVFALSSDYEGMPYVYLEALACGLPIVTTDVGGAELAIENGTNGFVVARQDEAAFANSLIRILDDNGLRERMSSASRERAEQFSLDRMLTDTLHVYGEARTSARGSREACRT